MHLHWKYRELVKVVVNARTFEQVKKVALALEAESGGVLVSVDRISKKKFAVIVFRGKDYQRPSTLRPKNLLTKRKALARSIEIQRQEVSLNVLIPKAPIAHSILDVNSFICLICLVKLDSLKLSSECGMPSS